MNIKDLARKIADDLESSVELYPSEPVPRYVEEESKERYAYDQPFDPGAKKSKSELPFKPHDDSFYVEQLRVANQNTGRFKKKFKYGHYAGFARAEVNKENKA
jgi:hypothetical protein